MAQQQQQQVAEQDQEHFQATLEALEYGDRWVPHDEVIRLLADASHMSLECDFDPDEIWPWLKQSPLNSSGSLASVDVPGLSTTVPPPSSRLPVKAKITRIAPATTSTSSGSSSASASLSPAPPAPTPSPAALEAGRQAAAAAAADNKQQQQQQKQQQQQQAVVVDVARLEALRHHPLLAEVELLEGLIARLQAIPSVSDKVRERGAAPPPLLCTCRRTAAVQPTLCACAAVRVPQVVHLMNQPRVQAFINDPRCATFPRHLWRNARRDDGDDDDDNGVVWRALCVVFRRRRHHAVTQAIYHLQLPQQYVLLSLLAMGQAHVLTLAPAAAAPTHQAAGGSTPQPPQEEVLARVERLASMLQRVQQFYDSIGGVLGYQCRSLDLIITGTPELRQAQRWLRRAGKEAAKLGGANGTNGKANGNGKAPAKVS